MKPRVLFEISELNENNLWSRVLPEKFKGLQVLKKFPVFYGNRSKLPHSQRSVTCPYPETDVLILYSLSNFLKTHLSNILSFTPESSKLSPSFTATCPAHFSLLDLITRMIFGEEYTVLSSLLCSFLYSSVTSPLLGPNILLSTLFSKTSSLISSLNMSDQVLQPCKTTEKIELLYILIHILGY